MPTHPSPAPRGWRRLPPSQRSAGLDASLPADEQRLLRRRYRQALVAEVNVFHLQRGLPHWTPPPPCSPIRTLDLYAGADSPHAVDSVGCTSCHDGSGQETDFVLTAHV